MSELLSIEITDEESLFKACDYLHDALFKSKDVTETGQTELRILFEREHFEDPELYKKEKARIPGFYHASHPMARSELILSNLKLLKRSGPQKYGVEVFNEVRRRKDGYHLEAISVKWTVEFDGAIEGSLTDTEILYDNIKTGLESNLWGCLLIAAPIILLIAIGLYFGWFP